MNKWVSSRFATINLDPGPSCFSSRYNRNCLMGMSQATRTPGKELTMRESENTRGLATLIALHKGRTWRGRIKIVKQGSVPRKSFDERVQGKRPRPRLWDWTRTRYTRRGVHAVFALRNDQVFRNPWQTSNIKVALHGQITDSENRMLSDWFHACNYLLLHAIICSCMHSFALLNTTRVIATWNRMISSNILDEGGRIATIATLK
jgi:hypothetical protein